MLAEIIRVFTLIKRTQGVVETEDDFLRVSYPLYDAMKDCKKGGFWYRILWRMQQLLRRIYILDCDDFTADSSSRDVIEESYDWKYFFVSLILTVAVLSLVSLAFGTGWIWTIKSHLEGLWWAIKAGF